MDIKEKIRKLLALATSPNENEAQAAMLKAKALMAKAKLTEEDFEEKKVSLTNIVCSEVTWTTDSGEIWMVKLCDLIAREHLCSAAWQTKHGTRTHTLVVAGMGNDPGVCVEVCKYAVGFVRNSIRREERMCKDVSRIKSIARSYADGFTLGLEIAYDAQKADHPEWGLAMVKDEKVREYEDGLGNKSIRTKTTGFDPLAYMRGQNDGTEFGSRKAIENR